MSDRTSQSSQAALRDLAEDINTRLRRAARRIRWPSGTPDVYDVGPINVAYTPYGGPRPLVPLISLEVDPGRWTFLGSSYWTGSTTSPKTPPYLVISLSAIGILVNSVEVARTERSAYVTDTPIRVPHFVSWAFVVEEPSVIELGVFAAYDEPFDDSNFSHLRLSGIGG